MAYNSSKGPQTHGDVKYEGDAEDTQIDFENDFVAIKTNGVQRLIINSNTVTSSVALSCSHGITGSVLNVGNFTTVINSLHISSSVPISGSKFYGDGSTLSGLTPAAITTYSNAADNRVITSVDSTSVQGEAGLTFNGSRLAVAGDISVSGVTGSAITGTLSVLDLTNGKLQIGNEEAGTGVMVKIRGTTDSDVPLLIKSPSHETILGVTGSGKVTVGGALFNAKLNVTGSDLDMLFEAKSNTRDPVFRVEGNGQTLISGSLILKNAMPSIYFSSSHSPGSALAQIGINSSDNILIQNDTVNKHIVFKVNDNGTVREGFRIQGAVPEVVVNEGSDSLVDFRVESNNNTHMLFVDGGTDKVGINTSAPEESLSVVGTTHLSGAVRLHTALKTANYTLSLSDRVVVFNATNGVTASLPALTATNVGLTYTIKNTGQHIVQVSASSAQEQFIDGLTTHDLSAAVAGSGSFVTVCGYAVGSGFDWAVIGKN
jgi:hypothetical protein|tara:strand:+ start:2746 stop:4206 length:1461 start_codon:yes stop_codon:yes gene_type:complete